MKCLLNKKEQINALPKRIFDILSQYHEREGCMVESSTLKQLKVLLQSYALLYVEDNVGLNTQATALFKKIVDNVYSAHDGEEGLTLFTNHRPDIVITDFAMPRMDGLAMAEAILKINPDAKIIMTTGHDDLGLLHRALRIGIFDVLVKPLKIENLIETLTRCSKMLKDEFHRSIFTSNLHTVFNHQNNQLLLLHAHNVVMANQPCLDFFGVSSIEVFRNRFASFGELLLEHNGFLYDNDETEWFEHIAHNPGKLFNVKIADCEDNWHHFILSYQTIPEKEGYGVLSLNDVSELHLLSLYDSSKVERERLAKDEKTVRGLLEMAMRSGAKIRVHNLYKGLSITNDGIVVKVEKREIVLKTSYVQLKGIQNEEDFYLTSELFPMAIHCTAIKRIDFEPQSVTFTHYKMVENSPTRRQAIRVVPDQDVRLTVFYEERMLEKDIVVLDISLKGIRFKLTALPPGFVLKKSVVLDLVLSTSLRPMMINTKAEVYRIDEKEHYYELVCTYELHGQAQKNMIDYVAKRQMVLIREFKGLQNEK